MKSLFDQTTIKNLKLKNRFVKAAVWESLATEDGHLTPELIKIYVELAKGGIGTIITGYTYVDKNEHPNPKMMGIYDDSFITEYQELNDLVHQEDANLILQLVYGGSLSNLKPLSKHILSPSGVIDEATNIEPFEMTQEDINQMVEKFALATLRAKKAGFDGIELHAAHGYLLSQFLSPKFNLRKDQYGGNVLNRSRIIVEIIEAIRAEVGDEYPILIKINSSDFCEGGLTSEDSIAISKILEEAGLDAIEVSGGNGSTKSVSKNNLGAIRVKVAISKENESYFKDHATLLSEAVKIPVILTGGNRHFDVMDQILNTSEIAYFGLARPLISEPNLIDIWANGNLKDPKCVSCNNCFKIDGKRCIYNQQK